MRIMIKIIYWEFMEVSIKYDGEETQKINLQNKKL